MIDKIAASNILEQYAAEVMVEGDDRLAAMIKDLDCFWTKNKVEELGNPTSWRIVQQCNEGDSTEKNEVIFTVQGIIASKALPPLTEKPRTPAAKYKFLRQSVTLSGLGTPTFENAMIAARDVHKRFDRHFAEGTLEPWTELDAGDQTSLSLDISNRYFTPRGEAHGLNHKEFLPGVDPRGILSDLAKGDGITSYVHTEDNQVLYFTAYRDREGTRKYTPCMPQTFRVGDIVQAQLSFVVVPVKGGRRKMLTVLRSLALIDSQFGSVGNKPEDVPTTRLASVKRRIGYETHDTRQEKSNKRNEMEVDAQRQPSGSIR